jgi:hypothetical protein
MKVEQRCFCGSRRHTRDEHIKRMATGLAKFRFDGGEAARNLRHSRTLRDKKYK